ncbi:hypothetical protein [Brevibacillus dissolubilis]|uniref:hypothetical protein n=1 Tax=Brevibacillus dissolubilis TaxID=1844116 RepID=UPI0011174F63|nr:hypothetical protein [Brevibacillus dissolubilis]
MNYIPNQGFTTGAQSVFQPGFAGTNVNQVRQDIAREGGFNSNVGLSPVGSLGTVGAYNTNYGVPYGATTNQALRPQAYVGGVQPGGILATGAQSVFQPGFAGTDVNQVRQDIAREGGFNSNVGAYGTQYAVPYVTTTNQALRPQAYVGGVQPGGILATNAQSVFQPGFAGTDVNQVRQDIAREGGFNSNYGTVGAFGTTTQGYGQNVYGQTAYNAGVQSVFQPGFAGTNVNQVRQDIAREGFNSNLGTVGAYGTTTQGLGQSVYGQTAYNAGVQPGGILANNVQAVFQPGFAGTDVQRVRQDIAREGGFNSNVGYGAALGTTNVGLQAYNTGVQGFVGGVQPGGLLATSAQDVFQPGFAGTDVQRVRQDIAREGGFNSNVGYGAAYNTFGTQGFAQQGLYNRF